MTNKATKRALLTSALALLLCVSMLVGTTYAWFTDSVTSTNNKIVAGNLAIDLELLGTDDKGQLVWTSVKEDKAPIFSYENWEPGYVDVKVLKVENEGSLALKWVAKFVAAEELGILADVIDVYVTEGIDAYPTDRADLSGWTKVGTVREFANTIETLWGGDLTAKGTAGATKTLGIALKMQETAGNEYQDKAVGAFDIQIFATQFTYEEDSFGPDYDAGAYLPVVKTSAELASALANGVAVKLGADMTLSGVSAISADLNLDGHTLTANLSVANDATVVISNGKLVNESASESAIESTGTLTLNNVEVASTRHAVRVEGGSVTINGGTYKTASYAGRTQHALNVSDGAFVVINDGTFVGPKGTAADSGSAVNVQAGSTVIIKGGNFSGGKTKTLSASGTLSVIGGTFDQNPVKFVVATSTYTENAGVWTVVPAPTATNEDIKTAVAVGGVAYVPAGNYTFPSSNVAAGTVIVCEEGTVFEGNTKLNIKGATVVGATFSNPTGSAADQTINGTFKDCTFTGSNGLRWCYAGETVVFENCVFSGDVYGVHFDGGANEVLFKNCTFSGFNAVGGAITLATYDGCTFVSNGKSGYNGINLWGDSVLTNCTFVFDGSVAYEWVEICGAGKTATFEGCVVTNGTTETPIEEVASARTGAFLVFK